MKLVRGPCDFMNAVRIMLETIVWKWYTFI